MKTDNLTISGAGAFNPADQSAGIEYVEKTAATRLQATGEIINATTRMLMGCAFEAGAKHGRAAIAQQPAPAVPDGWKLVPVEPTDDMLAEGQEVWALGHQGALEDCREAESIYTAMLSAAPPAAEQPDTVKVPRKLADRLCHRDNYTRQMARRELRNILRGKEGE